MKLAALFSGGKDSTYATLLAEREGHEIYRLVTIISPNNESMMWHTANIGLTVLQSACMEKELISVRSTGKGHEMDELKEILAGLEIEGVVCGGIESNYQKKNIENICKELKLKLIAPLWHKDPEKLLREMLKEKFEIIITAVAADGLNEKWLGRKIDEKCINDLVELNKKKKVHISGEGGEFESLVLNCPLFKRKLEIISSEKHWNKDSGILEIKDAKLATP